MRVKLNDTWRVVPSSLSEITLKQRIDFQNLHGNVLNEMALSIQGMEDEDEKELETALFNIEKMYRTMSFFLDCPIQALKDSEFIHTIINIYQSSIGRVFEDEQQVVDNLENEFAWNGEEWEIQAPELKHGHKMLFGEFIDAKQVIQNMLGLGKSRWECLLPLCAIFLRKKGEPYKESFLYEDSERLQLMEQLPMDMALQVGFFLNSSLNLYMEISRSSLSLEQKEAVSS